MIQKWSTQPQQFSTSSLTINPYRDSKQAVICYINRFIQIHNSNPHLKQNQNVKRLKELYWKNNFVHMYFQAAVNSIPQNVSSFDFKDRKRPGILYGMTVQDILNLMNVVVQTPPCYSPSQFSGVPFNSIFIDLINTQAGQMLFSLPQINESLKNIFNDYGNMLKSKESLKHLNEEANGWFCTQAKAEVDYKDFICDLSLPHYGFQNWNDWFTRRLKPEARPVEGDGDPLVIVCAAQHYPLTTLQLPVRKVKASDQFWLKENRYSLYNMFEAEKMGVKSIIDESFVGGTVYQGFLSPWCYHHWHSPIQGIVEKCYKLTGSYLLQNPSYELNQINNYDNSQTFLSCVSVRQVIIIKSNNPKLGRVALIQIGMVQVSTCICEIKEGDQVKKGQRIGRFQFGGSSHVIVFDRRAELEFNPNIYARTEQNGFIYSTKQKVNSWLARVK